MLDTKYITTKKYRGIKKGTKVYQSYEINFGLIREDEQETGTKHILVNKKSIFEDQTYENFTFPLCYLSIIAEDRQEILDKINNIKNENQNRFNENFEKIKDQLAVSLIRIYNKNGSEFNYYQFTYNTYMKLLENIIKDDEMVSHIIMNEDLKLLNIEIFMEKPVQSNLFGSTFFNKTKIEREEIKYLTGFELFFNDEDCGRSSFKIQMEKGDIELTRIGE